MYSYNGKQHSSEIERPTDVCLNVGESHKVEWTKWVTEEYI